MELEKNHLESGNPDQERQTWYVLTHKWILAVKVNYTVIYSPEVLGNKEGPKRDMWFSWEGEIEEISWIN